MTQICTNTTDFGVGFRPCTYMIGGLSLLRVVLLCVCVYVRDVCMGGNLGYSKGGRLVQDRFYPKISEKCAQNGMFNKKSE